MQKLTLLLVVAVIAVAVSVPIFADDMIGNTTNSSNISENDSGNITSNNTTAANATNVTLTTEQLQALSSTQTKLTALIAKIESLKVTYNSSKNAGLLKALNQFEKQAKKLNSQIQNLTAGNSTLEAGAIAGLINSIQKREAALEHKVSIKEKVLLKQSKKAKAKKSKKQKKHHKK